MSPGRLLDQQRIDRLTAIAEERVQRATETVRGIMYARGATSTPPGFVALESPEQVKLFSRYLERQAARENRGVVAGNLNQATVENPAVQEMAIESGAANG